MCERVGPKMFVCLTQITSSTLLYSKAKTSVAKPRNERGVGPDPNVTSSFVLSSTHG